MNRELDAEIAEVILGWKPAKVSSDAKGENPSEVLAPNGVIEQWQYSMMPLIGKVPRGYLAPRYSESLPEAIALCKKVGYNVPITLQDVPKLNAEVLAQSALNHYKSQNNIH